MAGVEPHLHGHSWSLDQCADVVSRRDAGETYASIGGLYGVTGQRVYEVYHLELRRRKRAARVSDAKSVGSILDVSIYDAGLRNRTKGCLLGHGFETVRDLLHSTESELLGIPNFGRKCLLDVLLFLDGHDLSLADGER